ncbi:MAG: hypothetical protein Q9163_003283 [Psora crenata]
MPQQLLRFGSLAFVVAALILAANYFLVHHPSPGSHAALMAFIKQAKGLDNLNTTTTTTTTIQSNPTDAIDIGPGSEAQSTPGLNWKPKEDPQSKYAFVSFLQGNALHEETGDPNDDEYFLSLRVLAYQLMHSPNTGTNTSIPFVACVTQEVSDEKKEILRSDGAMVIIVDAVPNPDWLSTSGINPRWKDLMTKLRVFQLTQFEKILLLDSDQLIVKRLDGIFQDPATTPIPPIPSKSPGPGEAAVPEKYMLAAQAQQTDWEHPYPPDPDNEYFGAGFFLAMPSQGIFEYYLSVLQIEGLFDTGMMEQNLLNYAHRRDGPMPWTEVYYTWTTTYPTIKDYDMGAHTLHHKWWWDDWDDSNTALYGRNKLTTLWYQAKGEMQGYYMGLNEAL